MKRRTFLGAISAGAAGVLTGGLPKLLAAIPEARDSTFQLGGDLLVNRLGFGAMRLTGEGIWGWPPEVGRNRGRVSTFDILINCARKPRSLRVITNRLQLQVGQNFLKPRIVPSRVPFPTFPQVGKRRSKVGRKSSESGGDRFWHR